jgi:hypothetical protein
VAGAIFVGATTAGTAGVGAAGTEGAIGVGTGAEAEAGAIVTVDDNFVGAGGGIAAAGALTGVPAPVTFVAVDGDVVSCSD